jgi:16S rRNA (cytosine967-C5)-methyltransferase
VTPPARIAAAIEVLDRYLGGAPLEQALTGWARGARYAGSKDRAAVRDHVFEAVRRLRSDAALGGASSGRGLVLGALRRARIDPETVFTGALYAPGLLSDVERRAGHRPDKLAERLDMPDWLWEQFAASQGEAAERVAHALQSRAPVYLRVNLIKGHRDAAISALAHDGVICVRHNSARTALLVSEGSRRIRQGKAFQDGLVELQDGASQAVAEALPLRDGMRVLDFCAGGGGKALAMAAQAKIDLFTHDVDSGRMRDLPGRAARAGVKLTILDTAGLDRVGAFDLVLCDAPCSGSGAWRRSPEGKWLLTPEKLAGLVRMQDEILNSAARLTAPDGNLAYATCSLLRAENEDQVIAFVADQTGWKIARQRAWSVQDGTDGFYSAHLTREV